MTKKYVSVDKLNLFYELIKRHLNDKPELTHNNRTNCPNCGAVITGIKCEYCGTNFMY